MASADLNNKMLQQYIAKEEDWKNCKTMYVFNVTIHTSVAVSTMKQGNRIPNIQA
jgi:hypothetical protein